MRLFLLPLIIFIVISLGADFYIYRAIRQRSRLKWLRRAHIALSALMTTLIIVAIALPRRGGSDEVLLTDMWLLYGWLTVTLPQLLFVIIDLLAKIPQLFGRRRLKWLSNGGTIISTALLGVMWWGALINRNELHVREVTVEVENLPARFDGYTIAQFSDAHVGTYGSDTTFVSKMVDRINGLNADVIVFTGDIVNRHSAELTPHTGPLSRLRARDGVYSIPGNHDYGDYREWPTTEAKEDSRRLLDTLQRGMGWRLLRDEHVWLRRGTDSIVIIGVENIGDRPFPTYGSLMRAYGKSDDKNTKILLTHNPAHWCDSIDGHSDMKYALTLSGHTHAMQMEVLGWSPAAFRYPTWGGLYKSSTGQQLYVNIGTGTVGFPARIGATPEITLIKLKRKDKLEK